ncbi:aminopeptidase N [Amnibacterium sp. CER49]|uniref:aminopeptidase N n=1 Tax=Amnibacterium sp. CER49 TaxID=3039161 RepID=UPI00244A8CB1|nr:aminopeptidase N [Amnibacterium sp. CER49]MDH2444247.1 aminopeptidase N [Amnibacterium sp. CER49]
MPGTNLTRDEAEERSRLLSIDGYDIDLDLTRGDALFGSTTTVRFRAEAGASTVLDALAAQVHAVRLNGRDLDPAEVADAAGIRLDGLEAENEVTVVADMRYTNTGEGLHRFVDPADGETYLYTQMAVPDARRMFAVFDQPDLKATYRLTVTAPAGWTIVSNRPTPEPRPTGEGAATWAFEPTAPLSSYLVALIAGPYVRFDGELESAGGAVPLGVLARASLAEFVEPEAMFEAARRGFAFYESAFGIPYPFGKYDQIFVPEYNWGAMENAGAVTFNEAYVFRSKVTDAQREARTMVVLHELAHMWFGDLVTMRWWDDLWLNESFATFMSFLATAEVTAWRDAWATFTVTEKNWAYRQDQLPSTHPIVAEIRDLEDVQVNFDGITYAKGASVLKQLVAYVGRDPFFAGVAAYLKRHAWGNATLADLLAELASSSGRDLDTWSRVWLQTAGVNTLRPELEVGDDGRISRFAVRQEASAAQPTLRPHRVGVGLYDERDGRLVRTDRIELDVDGERTEVPQLAGRERPALLLLNDDDLAYAKLRLDPASLEAATAGLSRIDSALARALVWGAVWDATRDAELPARDFVALVLDHAGVETSSPVLESLLGQVVTAAEDFVAPEHRTATLEALADGLLRLARAAEPASDAQLQLVGAFARTARSAAQLDVLAGLLDGTAILPGLDVDTDLRWRLLTGLAAGGRADDAAVDAELARDATAKGRESALAARAARPTADAKAAAWASVVDSDALPNSQVRAVTTGLGRGSDPGLLEPYVERYFSAVDGLWETRSFAIAEALAEGLYPGAAASPRLVEATRSWLDAHPDATPLRRIVVEHLADVERVLAAQARDAGR